MTRRITLLTVLFFSVNLTAYSQSADSLSKQTQSILNRHCVNCHSAESNVGAGPADLSREGLLDFINLQQPETSILYEAIKEGTMPPGRTKLSQPEVQTVLSWIKAGAPAFGGETIDSSVNNEQLVQLIDRDIGTISTGQKFIRYFRLNHIPAREERKRVAEAVGFLANALSFDRQITLPQVVDRDYMLLRVSLDDYKWTSDTWKTLLQKYPYSSELEVSASTEAKTGEGIPVVRADWFVSAASTAPLYYQVLSLPRKISGLEDILGVTIDDNLRAGDVLRAGISRSEVSVSNRVIERHRSRYGSFWMSYDFRQSTGRGDIFSFPLGPVTIAPQLTSHWFDHNGGEYIFTLPNGLYGFYISDEVGNRLDSAPVDIVSDRNRPDRLVTAGVSCFSCHQHGLIARVDEVSDVVEMTPDAWTRAELDAIRKLYGQKDKLAKVFAADDTRYSAAYDALQINSEQSPIMVVSRKYIDALNSQSFLAELDMTEAEVRAKLPNLSSEIRALVGRILLPRAVIERAIFEEKFTSIYLELKGERSGSGSYELPRGHPDYSTESDEWNEKLGIFYGVQGGFRVPNTSEKWQGTCWDIRGKVLPATMSLDVKERNFFNHFVVGGISSQESFGTFASLNRTRREYVTVARDSRDYIIRLKFIPKNGGGYTPTILALSETSRERYICEMSGRVSL